MRPILLAPFLVGSLASLLSVRADEPGPATPDGSATSIAISQEFSLEGAYAGESTMKQGDAKLGGVDNLYSHLDYVISPQITDNILLRFGVDAEHNSFSIHDGAALPNTLESANAIIGADFTLSDQIIVRAELHPGIYTDSTNITGNDFDMPLQIGGTYLWNKDFQLIFGLQIDPKSAFPILGLPGFRWQFADKWVLSAIPPKPQLQYLLNKSVTLYTGVELIGGTYQLNNDFGNSHGHGNLPGTANFNGNVVDFAEVRVGAGVTWKFQPNMSLDFSGGYMPYRTLDIHPDKFGYDRNVTEFHNNIGNGAPYVEMGISGSF
jgi:hypothetical protein